MTPTLDTVLQLLTQYGYVFLFLISLIEGPIVTVLGAFLASQGYFNLALIYVVVVLGDLAGDLLYYGIGRVGSLHPRWFRLLRMTPEDVERAGLGFRKHLGKTLFLAKYTQTGFVALPAAGALRIPVGIFLWYNFLATLPKSFGLMLLGYFFGYAYAHIDTEIQRFSLIGGGLVIIAVLVYMYRARRKKNL